MAVLWAPITNLLLKRVLRAGICSEIGLESEGAINLCSYVENKKSQRNVEATKTSRPDNKMVQLSQGKIDNKIQVKFYKYFRKILLHVFLIKSFTWNHLFR